MATFAGAVGSAKNFRECRGENRVKVLLVSANTEKINMPTLPVGLGFVAQAARNAGHRVRLIDLMGRDDPDEYLEAAITGFSPEVIGISVRNVDDQNSASPRFLLDGARTVVAACRRLSPAPLVLGGAGYSLFPESALEYLEADCGIQGEGEAAFAALLERLAAGRSLAGVPGLYLRGRGRQSPRVFLRELDKMPAVSPAFFDGTVADDPAYYLPVQTRRGCPLRCSYCATAAIEGAAIRKRSVAAVVRELKRWRSAGFTRIFFTDNTFNLPPTYARELCDAIAAAGLDLSWRCILYPGRFDAALARAMARAGCREVALGFESGNARVLAGMRKGFGPGEVRRAADLLRGEGIRRMGFLLLGGPDETAASAEESLRFADALDLEAVKLTVGIRIYPSTRLARIAAAEGLIDPADDLLKPHFYIKPGLEPQLRRSVGRWQMDRAHWIL